MVLTRFMELNMKKIKKSMIIILITSLVVAFSISLHNSINLLSKNVVMVEYKKCKSTLKLTSDSIIHKNGYYIDTPLIGGDPFKKKTCQYKVVDIKDAYLKYTKNCYSGKKNLNEDFITKIGSEKINNFKSKKLRCFTWE